jgi:hypothetical protein
MDELVAWCPDASLQQVCSSQEWKEFIKGHRESQAKKPIFLIRLRLSAKPQAMNGGRKKTG